MTLNTMNFVNVHEDGVTNHLNSTLMCILWDYFMHLCVNFLRLTTNPHLLFSGYDRCVLIIVFHHHDASFTKYK